MVNNNNVDNTNIQAIRTPTHVLLCQIIVSNVVKAMLFTVKLVQHSDQNATHVVKQSTGYQYVCQMEQNQNKGQGHKADNTKTQNLTINHNIGENSTWKQMQYTTTKKLWNKWKAWRSIVLIWPKEMKLLYSLPFNCQIEMASTSCIWRLTQGHKGTPY